MYRFLLTPRWWTINVFVALSIPFCLVMGIWQLGRFEDRVDGHREHQVQAEALHEAEEVPLAELLPPTTDTVGQVATATGEYDPAEERLVPRRSLDGVNGFYVLTPLRTADGSPAVPVVRGWMPGEADPAAVPPAPEGEVEVVGALQSAESPRGVNAPTGLPDGQVGVISAASLINLLPYEVQDAWLTVRDAEEPLVAVPPVAASGTGLDAKAFQNLGYTAEWFAFAAFVVFMWYRFFRREIEIQRDASLGLGGGEPPAPRGAVRAPDSPSGATDVRSAAPPDPGADDGRPAGAGETESGAEPATGRAADGPQPDGGGDGGGDAGRTGSAPLAAVPPGVDSGARASDAPALSGAASGSAPAGATTESESAPGVRAR